MPLYSARLLAGLTPSLRRCALARAHVALPPQGAGRGGPVPSLVDAEDAALTPIGHGYTLGPFAAPSDGLAAGGTPTEYSEPSRAESRAEVRVRAAVPTRSACA